MIVYKKDSQTLGKEEGGWTKRWITKQRDGERDNKERNTGAKVSKTDHCWIL